MFIIKIKGKTKIPDYVQLRDGNFTLLAYFRADRPEQVLEKVGLSARAAEIQRMIFEIPYGKIIRLPF